MMRAKNREKGLKEATSKGINVISIETFHKNFLVSFFSLFLKETNQ